MSKRKITIISAMAVVGLIVSVILGILVNKPVKEDDVKILFTSINTTITAENIIKSAEQRAEERGITLDVFDTDNIVAQLDKISRAKEEGYTAIICRMSNRELVSSYKMVANDLPIVFVNNEPSYDTLKANEVVFVGANEEGIGELLANTVLDLYKDKDEINIAVIKGLKNHAGSLGRSDGMNRVLRRSGKKYNIVFEDFASWKTDIAASCVEQTLKSFGSDIDAIICQNDLMALGAGQVIKPINKDTVVLGVDAVSDIYDAIGEGIVDYTIFQDIPRQGELAVDVAFELSIGKDLKTFEGADDACKKVSLQHILIDKSNYKEYMTPLEE